MLFLLENNRLPTQQRSKELPYLRQPRLQPHGLCAQGLARLLVLGHDPVELGVALLQDLTLLAEGGGVGLGDLEALRVVLLLRVRFV